MKKNYLHYSYWWWEEGGGKFLLYRYYELNSFYFILGNGIDAALRPKELFFMMSKTKCLPEFLKNSGLSTQKIDVLKSTFFWIYKDLCFMTSEKRCLKVLIFENLKRTLLWSQKIEVLKFSFFGIYNELCSMMSENRCPKVLIFVDLKITLLYEVKK